MHCNAGDGSVLGSLGSGVIYDEIFMIDPRGKNEWEIGSSQRGDIKIPMRRKAKFFWDDQGVVGVLWL